MEVVLQRNLTWPTDLVLGQSTLRRGVAHLVMAHVTLSELRAITSSVEGHGGPSSKTHFDQGTGKLREMAPDFLLHLRLSYTSRWWMGQSLSVILSHTNACTYTHTNVRPPFRVSSNHQLLLAEAIVHWST